MSNVEQIFDMYRQMRDSGRETSDIVRDLQTTIDPLLSAEKDSLGRLIRAYEKRFDREARANTQQAQPKPSGIKPLRQTLAVPTLNEQIDEPQNPAKRIKSLAASDTEWVHCPNCEKRNQKKSGMCYSCGALLGDVLKATSTRQFEDKDNRYFDSHYFSPNSVLILQPRDSIEEHEVFPQDHRHELVVGRKTDQVAVEPDVDLSVNGAEQLGVSRMHLAIKFNRRDNTIIVYDLGSANGTHINGQKLHPNEERILRSEDSLRLGRLVMNVRFLHPNAQLL